MTKSDLCHATSKASGHPLNRCEAVADSFLTLIGELLLDGHTVEIRNFGTFMVKDRKARPGRNPRTNEPVTIPARRAPLFRFTPETKRGVRP
jgi:nucleoid DNA-binding protein